MGYSNDPSGLKRSLAAARAEIERLTKLVSDSEIERYRSCGELLARADKAEAERDEALAQVAAAYEAAAQILDTHGDSAATESLGQRLCCNGHMCGCRGSTVGDYLQHLIRALTPSNAKAAYEAYGREKVREGVRAAWMAGRDAAAALAESDTDWTAFRKAGIEPWDTGPDAIRDYRLGIATGGVIAAQIRRLEPPAALSSGEASND